MKPKTMRTIAWSILASMIIALIIIIINFAGWSIAIMMFTPLSLLTTVVALMIRADTKEFEERHNRK